MNDLTKKVIVSCCIVLGGALNVIGVYNQRYLVGVPTVRQSTYNNSPYGDISKGTNFIDSKVTRSYITRATPRREGFEIDGVIMKCELPRLYILRKLLEDTRETPTYKVKITKEGKYTKCKLL
jgi:hypothetical protein